MNYIQLLWVINIFANKRLLWGDDSKKEVIILHSDDMWENLKAFQINYDILKTKLEEEILEKTNENKTVTFKNDIKLYNGNTYLKADLYKLLINKKNITDLDMKEKIDDSLKNLIFSTEDNYHRYINLFVYDNVIEKEVRNSENINKIIMNKKITDEEKNKELNVLLKNLKKKLKNILLDIIVRIPKKYEIYFKYEKLNVNDSVSYGINKIISIEIHHSDIDNLKFLIKKLNKEIEDLNIKIHCVLGKNGQCQLKNIEKSEEEEKKLKEEKEKEIKEENEKRIKEEQIKKIKEKEKRIKEEQIKKIKEKIKEGNKKLEEYKKLEEKIKLVEEKLEKAKKIEEQKIEDKKIKDKKMEEYKKLQEYKKLEEEKLKEKIKLQEKKLEEDKKKEEEEDKNYNNYYNKNNIEDFENDYNEDDYDGYNLETVIVIAG